MHPPDIGRGGLAGVGGPIVIVEPVVEVAPELIEGGTWGSRSRRPLRGGFVASLQLLAPPPHPVK